jgi:hypothetical protein
MQANVFIIFWDFVFAAHSRFLVKNNRPCNEPLYFPFVSKYYQHILGTVHVFGLVKLNTIKCEISATGP